MYYHSRLQICTQHPLCDDFILTTPGKLAALQSLGVTLSDYALFATANVVCVSLIFFACGALIAWKRWQTGVGLFVPLFCFIYGAEGMSSMLAGSIPDAGPTGTFAFLAYLSIPFLPLQYLFLSIFLLTFPTGRFQPSWSWALILLGVVNLIDFTTLTIAPLITVFLAFGACLVIQIYRYRRVYTYAQRQQVKWLVYGLGVSVFGANILTAILLTFLPSLGVDTSAYRLLDITGMAFFWLPIPFGIAIALVRYQLYDIDRLINRTVVYAVLTGILAAVYVGLVFALQTLVRGLTGQESTIAVVLSTLVVVALFQPVRLSGRCARSGRPNV